MKILGNCHLLQVNLNSDKIRTLKADILQDMRHSKQSDVELEFRARELQNWNLPITARCAKTSNDDDILIMYDIFECIR